MKVIGLTGGIGSGKSTVAQLLEAKGAVVIRADDLAKELMIKDIALVAAIKSAFGDEAYLPDGNLNKPYLSKIAFEQGKADVLNALVHPVVYRYFSRQIVVEQQKGTQLLIREAALLLLNGRPKGFDSIVVVTAKDELRIERVKQRSGLTEAEIKSRMQKQQSQETMISMADSVIENNGSFNELAIKVERLWQQWTQ
jgi:dephospho-CoA kinase